MEEENSEESSGISVWEGDKASNDYGPFGDGESRMFYEDLPDLISMIPLVVFGFTSEQVENIVFVEVLLNIYDVVITAVLCRRKRSKNLGR